MGRIKKALGFEDHAPDTAGVGADTGVKDFAALKAESRKAGKRESKADTRRLELEQQAEIDALFQPENWEPVACLYHDVRFATTGHEAFNLPDERRKRLGVTLAATGKVLIKINPGYIAAVLFLINFSGEIARSEMSYREYLKKAHPERFYKAPKQAKQAGVAA